jgi:hypothetical protein
MIRELHGVNRPHLAAKPLQREHRRRIADVPEGDMGLNRQQTHHEWPADLDWRGCRAGSGAGPQCWRGAINGSNGVHSALDLPSPGPPRLVPGG